MDQDLGKYNGRLPYASELYGVYQPLIGWRSRFSQQRAAQSDGSLKAAGAVAVGGPPDALIVAFPNGENFMVDGAGDVRTHGGERAKITLLEEPHITIELEPARELDSLLVRSIQQAAVLQRKDGLGDDDPRWDEFWRRELSTQILNDRFNNILGDLNHRGLAVPEGATPTDPLKRYIDRQRSLHVDQESALAAIFGHELAVARRLRDMAVEASGDASFAARMNGLLNKVVVPPSLLEVADAAQPFALMTDGGRDAVLSPVGIVHVFRQYFFELANFLGPAVEHVWLMPGSRIELYEVSTRKTLTEETIERSFEKMLSSETVSSEEEELSEAIKAEDSRDTKVGASVSGGASVLVVHGEASTSLSVQETQRRAREDNHRVKRQQSAKAASQIRNNFKSTFRSVTELTDTRSKKYVIENMAVEGGDPPKLRNFELRRKMRQVAVQTQDVGSQLCWQIFVDDPARDLGVGQLVHLAAKSDLSVYDEVAQKPPAAATTDVMTILCPVPRPGEQSGLGPIAASGFLGLMAGGVPAAVAGVAAFEVLDALFNGDDDDRDPYPIKAPSIIRQEFKVQLPAGYVIAPAGNQDPGDDPAFVKTGDIPLRHVSNGADLKYRMQIASATDGRLLLVVDGGRVTPGELLEFQMRVTIDPTAAAVAALDAENAAIVKDNAARTLERNRVVKSDFVNGVRERVTLASKIARRPAVELREEERTLIYRQLIRRLMTDAWSGSAKRETAHLRSEFIRSLFDVDKMFYSVAPEWWQPRLHQSSQQAGGELPIEISPVAAAAAGRLGAITGYQKTVKAKAQLGSLGNDDVVGWGGEGRADNYMITENSSPAKLGASLGWLLQLDGDNLRNAFLNAPWVKAVVPIRPGREREALAWLEQARVEGASGLDEPYEGPDLDKFEGRAREPGAAGPLSVGEVLGMIADDIAEKNAKALAPKSQGGANPGEQAGVLAPEEVFHYGFSHLAGGFKPAPGESGSFEVFDQWLEVLPTDQIVAVEVEYDAEGRLI